MTNRNVAVDVSTNFFSHPMRMDARRVRQLYDWSVERFAAAGRPPNTLEVKGSGFSGKTYLDFTRNRKRLEVADFNQLTLIGTCWFPVKQDGTTIGWKFEARSLDKWVQTPGSTEGRREPTGHWEVVLCMFPDSMGISESKCVDFAVELAQLTVDECGHVFFMRRNHGPEYYMIGLGYTYPPFPGDRTLAEGENVCGWAPPINHLSRPWLRDVYPFNFLGPRLAAMPVEETTLVEWLRADPTRGTVEPFPCEGEPNIVLWKPPINRIPELREQLYRAGLVWHREYNYGPFTPQEPPPEIMRAEFHAGRDPKLTR